MKGDNSQNQAPNFLNQMSQMQNPMMQHNTGLMGAQPNQYNFAPNMPGNPSVMPQNMDMFGSVQPNNMGMGMQTQNPFHNWMNKQKQLGQQPGMSPMQLNNGGIWT